MITTDPAYSFRNACINFMVEAYDIPNWDAWQRAGLPFFTRAFERGKEPMRAVNDYLAEESYNATGH